MSSNAKLALVVVVLVGSLTALGWWLWDPNPRPDRTELLQTWLAGWVPNPDGLEIIKCKQVRGKFLDRLRQTYPTLELVDCTFRHKDGVGNLVENTHHFWILDEEIIFFRGLTFRQLHGKETDAELETLGESIVRQHRGTAEGKARRAARAADQEPQAK
ncbi:MAG: hypothetical protein L0Z62_26180 [Gemmataceae bacterium]|nr:hypothetical protein [Gemmataceae bacterium]